jgi:hypothetical protein
VGLQFSKLVGIETSSNFVDLGFKSDPKKLVGKKQRKKVQNPKISNFA